MKAQTRRVNGFVLAGGRSTRMGRDKALLPWQGETLVEHAVGQLHALGVRARIAGSRPDLARFAPVVDDLHPGCGPLGGIEAALAASDTERNLFLPVDLPLLPGQFLRWLLERVGTTGSLATIPTVGGRAQPLCAIYHLALLPGMTAALERGVYKVMRGIEHGVNLATQDGQHTGPSLDLVPMEEIYGSRFDWPSDPPLYRWFQNMNTPADLAAST